MEAVLQAMQQQMADMKMELDNTKVQLAAAQASAAQANQQATAAAAAASASASASTRATGAARGAQAPASATPVIDTRILGKPDAFLWRESQMERLVRNLTELHVRPQQPARRPHEKGGVF